MVARMKATTMSESGEQTFELVLYGHDTVECAYYLCADPGRGIDFEYLGLERERLRQTKCRDPKVVKLGDTEFLLQRYGSSSGFPFVLDNADMTIQCGEFNSPSFCVTYRSQALWRDTAPVLHQRFLNWADRLGFRHYEPEGLSRVDFTFDYHLPVVDFDEESFVSFSSMDSKHRRDRKLRGVAFGQGDVRLRIYNKVAEIAEKSAKVWFFDLWGRKDDVWRIEWQVRKAVLRRFGIRTLADLAERQGDLLRYLAGEHDSLRVPEEDANRSRWPLHPLWVDLQKQVEKFQSLGEQHEVDPQAAIEERLARIGVSVYGYLKRVAALTGEQRAEESVSLWSAFERLRNLVLRVHHPVSWKLDVQSRRDELRVGGG